MRISNYSYNEVRIMGLSLMLVELLQLELLDR